MRKIVEGWFDGSHRTRDGESVMGIGALLKIEGHTIYEISEVYRGIGSSNCAEYLALIKLLEYIQEHHIEGPIVIRGDSKLVINQMKGIWRCHHGLYYPLAMQAKELSSKIKSIQYKWTSRNNNSEADKLSKI